MRDQRTTISTIRLLFWLLSAFSYLVALVMRARGINYWLIFFAGGTISPVLGLLLSLPKRPLMWSFIFVLVSLLIGLTTYYGIIKSLA